jgi:putative membrane protein
LTVPFALLGVQDLPLVNAILNSIATILLLLAYSKIRRRRVAEHRKLMIAAFSVSVLFLICYLTYHYSAGVVRFTKPGFVRITYFWILATHTVLAAIVPFLAIITLARGLRRQDARHRKIAKWTFPIWLYVSVTGVVVYLLLYQVQPRL